MTQKADLADLLNQYREKRGMSWDRLSQTSHIPKSTLINWKSGAVKHPRHWQDLLQVAIALELSETEADAFLSAADHPPIAALSHFDLISEDRRLLKKWHKSEHEEETLISVKESKADPVYHAHEHANIVQQVPSLPVFCVRRNLLESHIAEQLQHTEPIILWGMGGCGKTTLALLVAHHQAKHFSDGIVWCRATLYSSVLDIVNWIADILDLSLKGNTLAQRVAELRTRLRYKHCLIIFDDLRILPGIEELKMASGNSKIIVTSRDQKLAYHLDGTLVSITGLELNEGIELLKQWAGHEIEAKELVQRVGGLPLAIRLCGAQLRDGMPLVLLNDALDPNSANLNTLDLDEPQTATESLILSFDISYDQLGDANQHLFQWLGYFARTNFDLECLRAIWGISLYKTWRMVAQLQRFAILEYKEGIFQLHSLLHNYARKKLGTKSLITSEIPRYHAIWHIRHILYHPKLLSADTTNLPSLDDSWQDIIVGIHWAIQHDQQLATQAVMLAFSERAALLTAVGHPLIEAVEVYTQTCKGLSEQAVLYECLGDLHLFEGNIDDAHHCFKKSNMLWLTLNEPLAAGRTHLRRAGVYLLEQAFVKAAAEALEAQFCLENYVPIDNERLSQAQELFFWFDMVYNALIRWSGLPEQDVLILTDLAKRTQQLTLEARGLSIYRSWATTPHVERTVEIRQLGCRLALQAYGLWRKSGRLDRADDEISFTNYRISNRYSQHTARRFARRRATSTPNITAAQFHTFASPAIRWWLGAGENQRVDWLSRMLPRYLAATNRPLHTKTSKLLSNLVPGSRGHQWVEDILNLSGQGNSGRRYAIGPQRPYDHFLTGPEWHMFSGQKALPFVEQSSITIVNLYLESMDTELTRVIDTNIRSE